MDQESRICALAEHGVLPEQIAERLHRQVAEVHEILARNNIDWARTRHPGRPISILTLGQQVYIEKAWDTPLTQREIAARTNLTVARIKRHVRSLKPSGFRRSTDLDKRRVRLLNAISRYLQGDHVLDICRDTEIRPPVLYRALKERGIALRNAKRKETIDVGDNTANTVQEP